MAYSDTGIKFLLVILLVNVLKDSNTVVLANSDGIHTYIYREK